MVLSYNNDIIVRSGAEKSGVGDDFAATHRALETTEPSGERQRENGRGDVHGKDPSPPPGRDLRSAEYVFLPGNTFGYSVECCTRTH